MAAVGRQVLKVSGVRCEARDVLWMELRDPSGGELHAFTAGAHLEVHLANGLIRHYSLCNDPRERDRYCISVGLARDSRGGSRYLHDTVRVGAMLSVSAPRNHFPLDGNAAESVFIAGGIGITPIMAMIRSCMARRGKWTLFYCTRNRQRTAFYEELRALAPQNCRFHFDDEQEGRLFDAGAALADAGTDAHIYTCGPAPLMQAVAAAAAGRPSERLHFEWFTSSAPADTATDRAFTIVLANSGQRFEVPPGRSILEVLEDHDAGVPYSCREGLCGTCRTGVLAGEPDHRDSVLSATERASNREMMICVSRSRTAVLELDL
jgi:vanillate O-demethylase ferredoxin subunit